MPKIIVRIPTETYAFVEIHFDGINEYEKEYPQFVRTFKKVKKEIEKLKEEEPPFEGNEFALKEKSANYKKPKI